MAEEKTIEIQGKKRASRKFSKRQSRRQTRKQSRQASRSSKHSRKSASAKMTEEVVTSADILVHLKESSKFLESPVDLHRSDVSLGTLKPLLWTNYNANPLYLKMTNTTQTVVLNGLYPDQYRPTLIGGPLETPYQFSQLHFHWGENDKIGSEHLVEGARLPLEAHLVMYNAEYEDYETARRKNDGVIILVYMFNVDEQSDIRQFTNQLSKLRAPYSQIPLTTVSLESFIPPIIDDYILYFGNMVGSCNHGILWLLSRKTMRVTEDELKEFRRINASSNVSIGHNFREVKPLFDRHVFLVNGVDIDRKLLLHPIKNGRHSRGPRTRSQERRESKRQSRRSSRRASRGASGRQSKRRQSKRSNK